jgi:hypothetical protein
LKYTSKPTQTIATGTTIAISSVVGKGFGWGSGVSVGCSEGEGDGVGVGVIDGDGVGLVVGEGEGEGGETNRVEVVPHSQKEGILRLWLGALLEMRREATIRHPSRKLCRLSLLSLNYIEP